MPYRHLRLQEAVQNRIVPNGFPVTYHSNMMATEKQEIIDILSDKKKSGKERPWKMYKKLVELLAQIYDSLNESKANRLRVCGDFFTFKEYPDQTKTLSQANFCRIRLCPMCQWRKSLKAFAQMTKIMNHLKPKGYAYIFLTLTVKNCSGQALSDTITHMLESWKRLTQTQVVRKVSKGMYRTFEVTHNTDYESKDFDTYHPHIHAVIAVNPSYFKSRDYLSQARWTELWQDAARLDYTPMVNVKRVKGDTAKAVAEVSKYTSKPDDYILTEDWDLSIDTVRVLDEAFHNRRFLAFSGVFKEAHKSLNLDDVEKGNLVHVDDDAADHAADEQYVLVSYAWNSGYGDYYRVRSGLSEKKETCK